MNRGPFLYFTIIFFSLIWLSSTSSEGYFIQENNEKDIWGFYGHRLINRQAVFSLPAEMMPFFKNNIDYLTEHAIDPDKRRYASPFEAVRHYIDLDVHGEMPFENVPRNWTNALLQFSDIYFVNNSRDTIALLTKSDIGEIWEVEGFWSINGGLINEEPILLEKEKVRGFFIQNILPQYYNDNWMAPCDSLAALLNVTSSDINCQSIIAYDRLSEHGILPWHLQHMLKRLTDAFIEKDSKKIKRHAADIGHYIADAHVPLHTTENYNGQLTGQDGIHAFWESRLPELFAEGEYDFWLGQAEFIEDPEDYFWNMVLKSHELVDSVLLIEKELRKNFPIDRQMCNELRGEKLIMTQCEEFSRAYHERLSGMVEDRMKSAIHAVGSAWYSAWVLAGQPDLRYMDEVAQNENEELEKAVKAGKQKGRAHGN